MKISGNFSLAILLLSALMSSVFAQESETATRDASSRNLMPVPAELRVLSGRLPINTSFTVAATGYRDSRLQGGIERAIARLEKRTGLQFARNNSHDTNAATLAIQCQGPGKAVPSLDEDESYSLEVSARQAVLSAPTVVGALRGLETFLQLLEGDRDGYFIPSVQIHDKPRFPWRGLLVDVGRHWEPMDVIKRTLDGMAAVKLNVLHLHLTEDQGFRIESRRFPKLQMMGSDGLYYTQEQMRQIIEYARERAIRVVPEFDMPGHSTSWFVGYPELASAPGPYHIEREFGIMDPAFDPTREETYKFIDRFIGEMAALFPDAYMHIGGDESNGKQWSKNPKIQAFMKAKGIKDTNALQTYFSQRLAEILKKHGKKMVGWDEILHPGLPKDVVVQSWRGQASLAEAAKNGYDGILSSGYYLDLMYPASQHYEVDPLPAASDLTPQQAAHILGGEACMWGEYVDPETIDSRIWPRLAAIAERLWSPRTVTDVNDMYRRLAVISAQLEELGLRHETYEGRMLRRLAGGEETGPLKVLVGVVEPVKEYNRGEAYHTNQMTPLVRLVDAARADCATGREFAGMVEALLSDAPRFTAYHYAIAHLLVEWRDARPALDVIIDRSPILREAEPLSKDLSDLGVAGLEALEYLSSGVTPPPHWRDDKLALLAQAAKPKAEVEFAIILPLRQLIIAAAENAQLKTMSPAEWKQQVKALATAEKNSKAPQ